MEGVVVTMAMYRLSPGSSLEKEPVVIVMTTHPLFQVWERRGGDHAHTHIHALSKKQWRNGRSHDDVYTFHILGEGRGGDQYLYTLPPSLGKGKGWW